MTSKKKQIKFTIEEEIILAFKSKCASEGVSMTSVISSWMTSRQPAAWLKIKTDTSSERKKSVTKITSKLSEILENHEQYRDMIPEQFSQRQETADQFCEQIAEAISILEDAI